MTLREMFKVEKSDGLALLISLVALGLGAGLYIVGVGERQERVHDISLNQNSVTLHTGCYDLQMYTNPQQIRSIQEGYNSEQRERPNTHDLTVDLLDASGTNLERMEIVGMENNTFLADVVVDTGFSTRVDSRPTDAVAISTRTDTPIYVSRPLLVSHGEYTCDGQA